VLDDRVAAELAVESSLERSFAELGRRRADAVLFDGVTQAAAGDGAAWRRLVEYQRAGQVGRVGVRVATPAELLEALSLEGLGYLQLPFDALDRRRWLGDGVAEALESSGAVVAARSLAVTELLTVPAQVDGGRSVESISLLERLEGLARDLGREGVADLCMAYALGQPWLTSVVIHPGTEQQLLDHSRWAARAPLNGAGLEALEQVIPDLGGRP
jgi:spore coat polysaccharide biosynthesis protein SpsF